jgi:hypothetical protein
MAATSILNRILKWERGHALELQFQIFTFTRRLRLGLYNGATTVPLAAGMARRRMRRLTDKRAMGLTAQKKRPVASPSSKRRHSKGREQAH